ncbi:hypothetical protein N7452_004324 [Penicillium brevicompactum]|uniref:Sialidase n=1 Tax=Penicillium brevicompactum TaxID=5074 RepID=A0A9W9UGC9_PENBR|nr:hypothetical protein N7452_004324 [Penicillium brevicompactum]
MAVEHARYRPATPPRLPLEEYLSSGRSCHASTSSVYSGESSPWSTATGNTSPMTSPIRHHHGPALLPKIRPQDVVVEPVSADEPPRHHSRVLSNTRNSPGFLPYSTTRPSVSRQKRETLDRLTLATPVSPVPIAIQGSCSGLSSPVTLNPSYKRKAGGHSRSVSASVVDAETLNRFGYPTYRDLPKYMPQMQAQTTPTTPVTPITPHMFVYASYSQRLDGPAPERTKPLTVPTPQYYQTSAHPSPALLSPQEDSPRSTTLLSYLTRPIQPINLVRNVSVVPTRGMHDYFWWDIRSLRSWTSFSLATFASVDSRLIQLLRTDIPGHRTPTVAVSPALLAPESELSLVSLIRDLYAPRVNAALAVSQGDDHLQLYASPERTSSGLPRGRLVGIVKSFDRWNTGMRNEAPHRRVEYLNGLAHLQRCMREHSCRYGFIITEIELVCRSPPRSLSKPLRLPRTAIAPPATPISTRSFSSSSTSSTSLSPDSPVADDGEDVPMTASLALYFLLMLSKAMPLPHQPSAHLNVGGPGAFTRQRILPEPKDKWIPEPQIGERRDAKRVRGWVWPMDPWHRREGGGAPRQKDKKK